MPRPRVSFPALSDGVALLALYDATDGDSWQNNDGWLYTAEIGQWHGVATAAADRVIELDLSDNGLSGELPPELASHVDLTKLYLDNNQLPGILPTGLGSLIALTELYLYWNQLSGTLPTVPDNPGNRPAQVVEQLQLARRRADGR